MKFKHQQQVYNNFHIPKFNTQLWGWKSTSKIIKITIHSKHFWPI